MTHPRDRFREAPGRVTVIPQHPCRRRTDPDPFNDLRDAHNVPRNFSRCPAGGPSFHGSGLNDHRCVGHQVRLAGQLVAENLESSVAAHPAAEAPLHAVQHSSPPPQGSCPAVDFSQGGGADPLEAA